MAKKTLTQEELLELCKSNNIDISSLAAMANTLNAQHECDENGDKTIKSSAATTKPDKKWQLVLCNYPDIVIEKTTPQTTKQLVIMPSSNGYFIKSIKRGVPQVAQLTEDNYLDFTSGMPEIKLPEDFWVDKIRSGKIAYDKLMYYLTNATKVAMIKQHLLTKEADKCITNRDYRHSGYPNAEEMIKLYQDYPVILKEFYNDDRIRPILAKMKCTLKDLTTTFGLQNTIKWFKELSLSLYNLHSISSEYYYDNRDNTDPTIPCGVRPTFCKDFDRFLEYSIYSGVRFGYRLSLSTFFTDWADDLKMQFRIYGEVKDKYPKNLPLHHRQIIDKYNLYKEHIDEEGFKNQVVATSTLAYTMQNGDYTFLIPQQKEDFIDEAHQQANCLASYVTKFAEGRCAIIFMRNKETPEVSEVTIEVVGNVVTQALQASNRPLTAKQDEAVAIWANKKNLEYNSVNARTPRAAN